MFYNEFKSPALIKTGSAILRDIDGILRHRHLYFPNKILITQEYLHDLYREILEANSFTRTIFVHGGVIDEADSVIEQVKGEDAVILAFGGGSVLDIVKYCASKCDMPYITLPSALSNDAVYSCVSRLTSDGKKRSYAVQPPMGIIVDLNVIRRSPVKLIYAGVGDLVSNLSALDDWSLSHEMTGEDINELAFMLSKEAVMPLPRYKADDIMSDDFLTDLANGLITSGLAMIICGSTRPNSGAEHLISHAIDEYFPERASIHGLQVAWAHMIIEKDYRNNPKQYEALSKFYRGLGMNGILSECIAWSESELAEIIPYALKIRNRYTVFNTL